MSNIGANIKHLRELNGWSQAELARRIGKTRAAVSQYESSETTPRMGVIEDLARLFGVKKTDIIDRRINYAIISTVDDLTNEEIELVKYYRELPASAKRALMAGLRSHHEDTR